jgi:hypothetical protein
MIDQKQTQCKRIVDYIRANGHITSLVAYKELGVTQLCARIFDLESLGFIFNKPRFKVGNCKNPITHYSIAESGFEPWYMEEEEWG